MPLRFSIHYSSLPSCPSTFYNPAASTQIQLSSYNNNQQVDNYNSYRRVPGQPTFCTRAPSRLSKARVREPSHTDRNIRTKYAKHHSFVIIGVGLDTSLDEIRAAISTNYPAKMSPEHIRAPAMQAPTQLVRAFTRCKTTNNILISRGLMIVPTH